MGDVTVTYKNWMEWIVSTNNIDKLWAAQPTYLVSQGLFLLAGLITLLHACIKRGRWQYYWIATVLHGIIVDNFWHFILPEYDNFWHSQTPIMLLGHRLPVHILFLYPAFMYHAAYAVSKIGLSKYAEPFAVGLLVVLIDIPYDIVSVKFVHWTWHDTDPNIYDRHYHVPWNSYYFHATFAASFHFYFTFIRTFFDSKTPQWESSEKNIEWKSLFITVLLGMPGGVLLFIPFYHPLHDEFSIHSEVTFFVLFSVFGVIIINGLLNRLNKASSRLTFVDYLLILQLALHYSIYWVFVVFFNPEQEVSTGLHEPVGPCNEMSKLTTPFGKVLMKRKYLCVNDYDEGYFDFACVGGKTPTNGADWYTICGTPFVNRYEYICIITTIIFVAFGIFYGIYFKCGQDNNAVSTRKQKQKKNK